LFIRIDTLPIPPQFYHAGIQIGLQRLPEMRISLNRIADILGVHPSYLSRAFKKELGVTLTDYINKLRIEEVKYMLDH
jgi:AraC-like DNA-binding protein